MVTPAFHNAGLKPYVSLFSKCAHVLVVSSISILGNFGKNNFNNNNNSNNNNNNNNRKMKIYMQEVNLVVLSTDKGSAS